MYVYRVAVIVEDPDTGQRMRREYHAKASRMALAVQRALDYDQRIKTGRQGQDVGIVVRKLGRVAEFPQESEVRPLKAAEMLGGYGPPGGTTARPGCGG